MKKSFAGIVILLCALILMVGICLVGCDNTEINNDGSQTDYINVSFYLGEDLVSQKIMSLVETLRAPSVTAPQGYTLDGWYFDKNEWTKEFTKENLSTHIQAQETQVSVFAKITPIEYQITYENVKNAAIQALPKNFTVESETIAIPAISVEHYNFVGWFKDDQKIEQIAKGTVGNVVLTARFTPINYTVTYNNTKDAKNDNPDSYHIDSGDIALSSISKDGYSFEGWYRDDSLVSTIPANSHGDIQLTAKWSILDYSITYADHKTADVSEFPKSFTVESETIAIPAISVDHYNFIGWFKDDQKIEQIAKGTVGNVVLTAKFEPIEYTITYNNTKDAKNDNPRSYHIDSSEITLSPISKDGYSFEGWFKDGAPITTIPTHSYGDIELAAKWSIINYAITYEDCKSADVSALPTGFTVESETITIPAISVEHYNFIGWFKDGQKVEHIAKGTVGNMVLTAKFAPIEYTITYNNTKDAQNVNPDSYTIDSAEITLSPINKDGYTFNGWFVGDTPIATIPAHSHGNIELSAQWSIIEYSITYNETFTADTEAFPKTYTIESDPIVLPDNVEVTCRIFEGWKLHDQIVTQIPTGTVGNLVLTATYTLDHIAVTDAYVAPTCDTTGLTEGSHCEKCNEIIVAQNEISALGHNYTDMWEWDGYTSARVLLQCKNNASHELWLDGTVITNTVNSTCTTEGSLTYIATAEFQGIAYADRKTESIPTIDHNFVPSETNENAHICTMCNQECEHVDENYTGQCSICGKITETIIEVFTKYDLVDINNNLAASYVLRADITLDGDWTSIGSINKPFTGKFYGNGFTISNLTTKQGAPACGLFACNNGLIDGLTLSKLSVTLFNQSGNTTVVFGGIAAYNNGTIRNCNIVDENTIGSAHKQQASSSIASKITYNIGSICGVNKGNIEGCVVSGVINNDFVVNTIGENPSAWPTVTTQSTVYFGNIAGINEGNISKSTVSAEDKIAFSALAYSSAGGATANAYLHCYVGSLVGENRSTVTECKAKVYTEVSRNVSATVGWGANNNDAGLKVDNAPLYEGIIGVNGGTISKFEPIE